MNVLNQVEVIQPLSSKISPEPNESVLMECARLIHAAVISRRFLSTLLVNPIQSIQAGYCGEKFAFTHAEKQQIKLIHANTLAEFSNQLMQAIERAGCVAPAAELAYVRVERPKGRSL